MTENIELFPSTLAWTKGKIWRPNESSSTPALWRGQFSARLLKTSAPPLHIHLQRHSSELIKSYFTVIEESVFYRIHYHSISHFSTICNPWKYKLMHNPDRITCYSSFATIPIRIQLTKFDFYRWVGIMKGRNLSDSPNQQTDGRMRLTATLSQLGNLLTYSTPSSLEQASSLIRINSYR